MNIAVTDAAQKKLIELATENNMPGVRAFIYGGGCAGMQHSLTFVDEVGEKDTEVSPMFYVDPVAMAYMDGATIDYDESGMSPTFVFQDVFKAQGGSGLCGGCGAATGPGYRPH